MRQFDREKFRRVVHYICWKASDPSVLGAVKLNKVLWYADVVHYMISGEPITGETYVKRQHGPVPTHILPVIEDLIHMGKIARGKVDHYGFVKTEFIPIEEPDISAFKPEEIARIDEAFEHVCMKHTAKSISEETHGLVWQLASMGEPLPYSTVFASAVGEVDESDIAWASKVISSQLQVTP